MGVYIMKEQLKEIGLTENESKIYISLLELGPTNAGLISRKSGLHRRVVYDTIEMLIQKGLVGYIIKNNVKLFQASNPKRILEIIEERKNSIEEIMPNMAEMYLMTHEKEETNFYKGKNGLKTVMEDQLDNSKKSKEILIIGGSPIAYEILQFYFKWFDKRRVENKIKVKVIFNKTDKKLNIPYSEIKFLPDKYSSPLAVNVYGDKAALILWSKENPLAIVIKNKEISNGYRKYFELMWRVAKS